MEKAFDRVSYEFTKKGLDAYGFGARFQTWVGMTYDEKKAPRRRMYVNGYYSEWFPILSGVAQGLNGTRVPAIPTAIPSCGGGDEGSDIPRKVTKRD
eukprot:3579698-Prymnesium_polylepis.1